MQNTSNAPRASLEAFCNALESAVFHFPQVKDEQPIASSDISKLLQ